MPRLGHICLFVLVASAVGVTRVASGAPNDETLLVIVHPSVNVSRVSGDELSAIYTMTKRSWPGGLTIVPFNYDPNSKLRTQFDRTVLGMTPDQAARFWIDSRIRGGSAAPRKVSSASLMVRVIAQLAGAVGYVPLGTSTQGSKVVARILRNQVLAGDGR